MKKGIIALIMVLYSVSLNAQRSKIIGSWLLTRIETPDSTQKSNTIVVFTDDGKMLIKETLFAIWQYRSKSNEIKLRSTKYKHYNGISKVLKLTDKELILEKEGVKSIYLKLNFNEIAKENTSSNLIGNWKIENEVHEIKRLNIALPNTFKFTVISSDGATTLNDKGTWVYNANEKSILFIGMSEFLKGKSFIKELSENNLILQNDELEIVAKKEVSSARIEHLTFNVASFPNRQSDISPWTDFDALLKGLENVTYLKYKQSKLIPNTHSFKDKILLSKIDLDIEKRSISLVNLQVIDKDTIQYSESYKGGLLNRNNNFFPQKEPGPYRIVKTEMIKVPAGEFDCKVVEGFDGEAKLKFWMVIDKPGVYAKIIREDLNIYNKKEYAVTELVELK